MYSIQLRLNQNVFYRYCVVPSGTEQKQVIAYLVNLLHINEAVNESISKNENVFVLGDLVDKRRPIENGFIDSY